MGRYNVERTDADTKCVGMKVMLYVPRTGAPASQQGATPLCYTHLITTKQFYQRMILKEEQWVAVVITKKFEVQYVLAK